MPRIPILHEDDPNTPEEAREVLREIKEKRGVVLNVYRALANHPALAANLVGFYATARSGGLTPAECELAYTSASVANSCFY